MATLRLHLLRAVQAWYLVFTKYIQGLCPPNPYVRSLLFSSKKLASLFAAIYAAWKFGTQLSKSLIRTKFRWHKEGCTSRSHGEHLDGQSTHLECGCWFKFKADTRIWLNGPYRTRNLCKTSQSLRNRIWSWKYDQILRGHLPLVITDQPLFPTSSSTCSLKTMISR